MRVFIRNCQGAILFVTKKSNVIFNSVTAHFTSFCSDLFQMLKQTIATSRVNYLRKYYFE